MNECYLCLGTKEIIIPTRDGTDLALCPYCFPSLIKRRIRKFTVQHPSGTMVINRTEEK